MGMYSLPFERWNSTDIYLLGLQTSRFVIRSFLNLHQLTINRIESGRNSEVEVSQEPLKRMSTDANVCESLLLKQSTWQK